MENILYRLTTSTEEPSAKGKETHLDYLDYEEALSCYNKAIESKTSGEADVQAFEKPYLLVKNDYESNPRGQWHWCNLKNEEGALFTMRIEPIHFFEAEYFASEDIEERYKAIYGYKENSSSFFTRLFKRRK
ncbi:hypothetical protein [Planomicrobium sp. CPCC 101110]|uniref:hypothetical protein n=1 Tax=Planomicrobium sp. CPCC 101110 TaxID=2599619 RepID=UPI0011B5449F|nr:hypothetical protein [Planomicrobium sp. CPCC 101110]TWT28383.1 hypothetical protein FQV30_07735 [Planomicrobium sp. CPCC 101110]